MQQLDPVASAELKHAGQQLALDFSGEWKDDVIVAFAGWVAMQKAKGLRSITIEQFRASTTLQPHSHKAWGALPRILVAKGLIRPALDGEGQQRYQRAAAPKTHAHPVAVWEIV